MMESVQTCSFNVAGAHGELDAVGLLLHVFDGIGGGPLGVGSDGQEQNKTYDSSIHDLLSIRHRHLVSKWS